MCYFFVNTLKSLGNLFNTELLLKDKVIKKGCKLLELLRKLYCFIVFIVSIGRERGKWR